MAFFEEEYLAGAPSWEIGRPQEVFVQLAHDGGIRGDVLDVGCGTGENALLFASEGHPTWGIDVSRTAIMRASEKASRRNVEVNFQVADALKLSRLGRAFDTVTDCGLFPFFSEGGRHRYTRSLADATRPGGTFFLLCYSEREPDWGGPRRVTEAEIRSAFSIGWNVRSVAPARLEASDPLVSGFAWLATIDRLGAPAPIAVSEPTRGGARRTRPPAPKRRGGSAAAPRRAPRR